MEVQLPEYLSRSLLESALDRFLEEDVGTGDITTAATIRSGTRAKARFLAKQDGILAGSAVAALVFERIDPEIYVRYSVEDGDPVGSGDVFGVVEGAAASILTGERLALNLMQRMSGIATATSRMSRLAHPATILDTRKTAPGLRLFDKWAVLLGGGKNHRMGLYDSVLIKDNHVASAGGMTSALDAVRRYMQHLPRQVIVEIETRTLDEVRVAAEAAGIDWILLDNMVRRRPDGSFDVSMLQSAVDLVAGRKKTEASGNVTEASVSAIASTGVDAVSAGSLTHSVRALDISLDVSL